MMDDLYADWNDTKLGNVTSTRDRETKRKKDSDLDITNTHFLLLYHLLSILKQEIDDRAGHYY